VLEITRKKELDSRVTISKVWLISSVTCKNIALDQMKFDKYT